MPIAPVPPVVVQKKRGWGCWGCGCAVLAVLAVLVIGLLILGYRQVTAAARQFTSDTPAAIPITDSGEAVYQRAHDKINLFVAAAQSGRPATLHLSADEINTLIARDPDWAVARGRVHVTLDGSSAQVESAFQLGAFEKFFLPDRYVNSVASIGLEYHPATRSIAIDLQQIQLNGQTLPPSSSASLSQSISTVATQKLQANPTAQGFLARVQKIDIENGELVIESR